MSIFSRGVVGFISRVQCLWKWGRWTEYYLSVKRVHLLYLRMHTCTLEPMSYTQCVFDVCIYLYSPSRSRSGTAASRRIGFGCHHSRRTQTACTPQSEGGSTRAGRILNRPLLPRAPGSGLLQVRPKSHRCPVNWNALDLLCFQNWVCDIMSNHQLSCLHAIHLFTYILR